MPSNTACVPGGWMSDESNTLCRCGHDTSTEGAHPCHGKAHTCKEPGTRRLYVPTMRFSLAGVQPKLSVSETFACDACWDWFSEQLKEHLAREAPYEEHRQARRRVRE